MKRWLFIGASAAGVLAFCLLIWFVFPIIGFAGVQPFESIWLRLSIIVAVMAIFCCYHAYQFYKRRRAAQEIEAALTEGDSGEPDSDAAILAEKMTDALLTLKKSQKTKGDFLYELPWYLIIGPPGSGKTTALLNSGLKFPLSKASANGPIAGTGGTRYCDWWFTEEAVLIDTAGRYTTQDSDTEADRKSWLSFLDLLKKNRPRQPINGVLVAISLDDLMSLKTAEIAGHAVAIRKRLAELSDRLQVDYPVYALFTKADLISGFMEYFGGLNEQKRKLVWGATFKTGEKTENKVSEVGPEIDLLIERLSLEMPDRLQEEADPLSRVKLFGLPSQLASLKPTIVDFLNQIFEPTRYHSNAALRGFYLTSGTQEGTPVDKVLGAISGSFGIQGAAAPAYSGRAKSFFLGDLLTKVIFGEAGWVTTNREAVRRANFLRYGGYALACLVGLVVLGAWWVSYLANSNLISGVNSEIDQYQQIAKPVIEQSPVDDTDFTKTLDLLHKLKYLPAGYGTAGDPTPIPATFGLSQRERLQSSATATYRVALDRTLRSRIILFLERQIEGLQNEPALLYEPLKVYLMLGGDPNIPIDDGLILGWMKGVWESLYPGAPNKQTREQLLGHLDAMLRLNTGTPPPVQLNGDLVKASQSAIVRLSLAERAFALIKSNARGASLEEWNAKSRGGGDAEAVFETVDGSELETVRVPNLYTYKGFHELFLGKLEEVTALLDKERWVLGEAGQQGAVEKQYRQLGPDLLRLYDADFINSWNAALNRLKLKSLASGSPDYPVLSAATGQTSPVKLLMESVSAETKLTEEREAKSEDASKALDAAAAEAAQKLIEARVTGMAKIGLDVAKKSAGRGGEVEDLVVPGATIEAHFRRYHELAEDKGGKNQIDLLIDQLRGVYQSLIDEQSLDQAPQARQNLQKFLGVLASSASRLDPPFSTMIKNATGEFEDKIVNERIADLKGQLNGMVTRKCLDIIGNKFPFSASSKRDVPMAEFARLFGPNGVFDTFFKERLVGLVDTSGERWAWKKTSKLGQELSKAALIQFQNADRIRNAFFTGSGTAPYVKIAVAMQTLSQQAASATFEVNGIKLESPYGVESRGDFEWPGSSPDGTASITLPEKTGSESTIRFNGPWALYRLLNAGAMTQSGNRASVRFIIGGREVSYQLTFDSLDNPFFLLSRMKFSCPAAL